MRASASRDANHGQIKKAHATVKLLLKSATLYQVIGCNNCVKPPMYFQTFKNLSYGPRINKSP